MVSRSLIDTNKTIMEKAWKTLVTCENGSCIKLWVLRVKIIPLLIERVIILIYLMAADIK